jgi:hypothetical protein
VTDTIKSLFEVKNMPATTILLFQAFKFSLVGLYMALFVVELVLKPNCSSAEILL